MGEMQGTGGEKKTGGKWILIGVGLMLAGIVLLAVVLAGKGFFEGRGDAPGVETDEDFQGADSEKESQSDIKPEDKSALAQFRGEEKWTEQLKSKVMTDPSGNPVVLNIEADITIPELDSLCVVEVEEPEINEEYKERMVKAALGEEGMPEDASYDYKQDCFRFTWQNLPYDLYFEYPGCIPHGKSEELIYNTRICFGPTDYLMNLPQAIRNEIVALSDRPELDFGQEQGELPESFYRAKETAEDLFSRLQISGLVMTQARGGGHVGTAFAYLYEFTFRWGRDGVSFSSLMPDGAVGCSGYRPSMEPKRAGYGINGYVTVTVTDRGIFSWELFEPIGIRKVTEGVNLLPFSGVKSAYRSALEKREFATPDHAGKPVVRMNTLSLGYMRIKNEKEPGVYCYVPAWNMKDGFAAHANLPVVLNAMDGTEIDMIKEILEGD